MMGPPNQKTIVTEAAGKTSPLHSSPGMRRGNVQKSVNRAQRKSPAALAAGLDSLFFKRGNCESGNRIQMLSYCYWILILFFLFLLFFWRLNPFPVR